MAVRRQTPGPAGVTPRPPPNTLVSHQTGTPPTPPEQATPHNMVRHLRHTVAVDGDEVVLRLHDRTLRLPAATAKAVRSLLDGDVLRVADLPGLEPADALVLARRLVREAVAVVEGR